MKLSLAAQLIIVASLLCVEGAPVPQTKIATTYSLEEIYNLWWLILEYYMSLNAEGVTPPQDGQVHGQTTHTFETTIYPQTSTTTITSTAALDPTSTSTPELHSTSTTTITSTAALDPTSTSTPELLSTSTTTITSTAALDPISTSTPELLSTSTTTITSTAALDPTTTSTPESIPTSTFTPKPISISTSTLKPIPTPKPATSSLKESPSTVAKAVPTSTPTPAKVALAAALLSFADTILKAHNEKRALHGVPDLVWDNTLALYAQKYGDSTYKCDGALVHSSGKYGENLAAGYSTTGAIEAWYDEGKSYSYSIANTYDHFTQVVWKSTTKMGCAEVLCPNTAYGTYIICSYDPAGNAVGRSRENVLPPL